MEEYPEEIREFPRPVIALLKCPSEVSSYLSRYLPSKKQFNGQEVCSYYFIETDLIAKPIPKKERRQTYEGYIPPGIIKANWILKHYHQLPCIATIFLPLDDSFRSKESEFVNELETLKRNSKNRNIKLVVIFLSNKSVDSSADERVSSIRKKADLDSKAIFIWDRTLESHPTALSDLVKRLEKLYSDSVKIYYREEAKKIKKEYQRANLNKHTQQALFVRLYFKVAYLAEFRKDQKTCLKYYSLAYASLREVLQSELRTASMPKMGEIKTLADYFNFQICKLFLFINYISEAINQFQKHLKLYKPMVGASALEFQHWAWVSRQHQVFAQLLEFCIPSLDSLEKFSNQHPAFYYQAAAKYAMDRKDAALRLCPPIRDSPIVEEVMKENKSGSLFLSSLAYVGQELEEKNHPLEVDQVRKEDDSVEKKLARELLFDHAGQILNLLKKAHEHYKGSNSKRTELHILCQIAHQYFALEDYQMAKKNYERIAEYYRSEGWYSTLTEVLSALFHCNRELGLIKDYFAVGLELLTKEIPNSIIEKKNIQTSLIHVLKTSSLTNRSPESITIKMPFNHSLITVKVRFNQASVYANSPMSLKIGIHTAFPLPITFSKLKLYFSDKLFDREIVHSKEPSSDPLVQNLEFNSLDSKEFILPFISTESTLLKCHQLIFELKPIESVIDINFEWDFHVLPVQTFSEIVMDSPELILHCPSIRLLEHEAKVEISYYDSPPALVDELFPIEIKLKNLGEPIRDGKMTFFIDPNQNDVITLYENLDKSRFLDEIQLSPIDTSSTTIQTIFLMSRQPLQTKLFVKVSYHTLANYTTAKEISVPITVQHPFIPKFNFLSPQFQSLMNTTPPGPSVNESFFLSADIHCATPNSLYVLTSNLVLNDPQILEFIGKSSINQNLVLSKDDQINLWYEVIPKMCGANLELGFIEVRWRRYRSPFSETNQSPLIQSYMEQVIISKLPIPPLIINVSPFSVKIDVPSVSVVGTLIPLTISITNHTELLQEFAVTVKENTHFLFSGDKTGTFCVHPNASFNFRHNLVPLTAGRQPLPQYEIISKRFNKELSQTKQIQHIFIKP